MPEPIDGPKPARTPAKPGDFASSFFIEHGPRELIGPYILALNKALNDRGVTVQNGSFEELLATNEKNLDSWPPLVSTLNPELHTLNAENSFCFLGRDETGEVVATQAGRLFDMGSRSFKDITESLELFYADPKASARPGETWTITAPKAAEITGRIAYTGAVWYHPRFRGRGLASLMPRIARAYALTTWDAAATIVFMSNKNFAQKLHEKTGHVNFEPAVHARKSVYGDADFMFFWMYQQDIIREMGALLAGQADGIMVAGRNAQ